MQDRRERLVAPPSWWLGALVFAAVWGWIALVVSGPTAGVVSAVVAGVLSCGAVARFGAVLVQTGPDGVRAGRAVLPAEHVGTVTPLDPAATRHLLGPGADARAWLCVRPYVDTAVRIDVADPADRVPYWVVSTRDPSAVARSLGPAVNRGDHHAP